MNRPEYVKCILLGEFNNGKPTNETWCARKVDDFEFTFVDATHAALNGRNQGRLVACKSCADAINNALMNGRDGGVMKTREESARFVESQFMFESEHKCKRVNPQRDS